MHAQLPSAPVRAKPRLLLVVVVVLGLAITVFFGVRAVSSFRQLQYIHQQGLDRGTASVDAVRPWMTLRFIAVAYAVPVEYMYSQLNIPFNERDADHTLGQLNSAYHLRPPSDGVSMEIIDRVKTAITAYRANPVVTGLRDVRPWMSIQYISNSSGVPTDYIFKQLGWSTTSNANKPLDLLSNEQHYQGGPRALADAIEQILATYKRPS